MESALRRSPRVTVLACTAACMIQPHGMVNVRIPFAIILHEPLYLLHVILYWTPQSLSIHSRLEKSWQDNSTLLYSTLWMTPSSILCAGVERVSQSSGFNSADVLEDIVRYTKPMSYIWALKLLLGQLWLDASRNESVRKYIPGTMGKLDRYAERTACCILAGNWDAERESSRTTLMIYKTVVWFSMQ